MTPPVPSIDAGTGSADYSAAYFHGSLGLPYEYDEPHWAIFFGAIADSLIRLFEPRTTYDAGCARGFLVRELAERGVDARGGDISEYAIGDAPPDLATRLEVRDLTDPFDERFDLITCIEVLEHMAPDQARKAIGNLCAATDRIVLSSTPDDFTEATHINVRQPAEWAQDFAVHGFFRRTDIDASFVSPWAVVFERATVSPVEIVVRYEAMLAPLLREVDTKRRTLLEVRRELDESLSPVIAERDSLAGQVTALQAQLESDGEPALAERGARLIMVDELIGLRAKVARLENEAADGPGELERARLKATIESLTVDLARAREQLAGGGQSIATADSEAEVAAAWAERDRQLAEIKRSTTWRVGRAVLGPLVRVQRLLGRTSR